MKGEKTDNEGQDHVPVDQSSDLPSSKTATRHISIIDVVIIGGILLLVLGVIVPAFRHARYKATLLACGHNLQQIGISMGTYINDYDGQFPRSGGINCRWFKVIPFWTGNNRYVAYGLAADGTGGVGSISSSFYLLIKFAYTPSLRAFVCKGDTWTTVFNPADEGAGDRELKELWDFGPDPAKHCSYSYHHPFGPYHLTKSSDPGMALVADRNPWIVSPSADPREYGYFNPDGSLKAKKAGNATTHKGEGQNVLFVDGHVAFERRPYCGINDDNIYTFWDGSDIRRGGLPTMVSTPGDEKDSFLVHDGY